MWKKALLLLVAAMFLAALAAGCSRPAKPVKEEPAPAPTEKVEKPAAEKPAAPPAEEKKPEAPAPPAAPAVAYVGSESCKGCHANQYKGWEQTLHGKMLQDARANPAVLIGDFSKEGEPLATAGAKKEDIIYALGSKWKQRYIIERGEKWLILPAQWVPATKKWTPYNADKWQEADYKDECAGCHTVGYNAQTRRFVEAGVGCESCHGPGGNHIKSMQKADIVNPKTLSAELQTDLCGSCHARGKNNDGQRSDALGYLPGGKLADYYTPLMPKPGEESKNFYADGAAKQHRMQWQDYVQSKHYQPAGMSCSSCHSSHGLNEQGVQLVSTVDKLCASCHGQAFAIDKAMPGRANSAVPGDIRSHTFKPGQPSAR